MHARALGEYLRAQRRLAELSLRELAERTHVSNSYLSQIERGLHEPSVRVLRALAEALDVPPDRLLAQVGLLRFADPDPANRGDSEASPPSVEAAVRHDDRLTPTQKQALIAVYWSYLDGATDPARPGGANLPATLCGTTRRVQSP